MTDPLDDKKNEIEKALREMDKVSSERQAMIGEIEEQQAELDKKIESSLKKLRPDSSD
jgi:hypothetical protein